MTQTNTRSLWIRLFLPFAAGYFLSYLYRTVNAIIGPVLARELSLPDNALGLLTSTYFLAFGLACTCSCVSDFAVTGVTGTGVERCAIEGSFVSREDGCVRTA